MTAFLDNPMLKESYVVGMKDLNVVKISL